MVFPMRLISILVERVSEVTIFVPSDRTTFSNGVINNANGRLLNIIRISDQLWPFLNYSRKALNDHEGNKGIRSNSTTDTFFMVLR